MVTDAWLPEVSLQGQVDPVDPQSGWPGCCINVRCCDPSATERPLGTIREEKGISSRLRVYISSLYDISC